MGTPNRKKNRAKRNKARRESGLKKGDDREVDHIVPLSKGGSNSKGNTRVVSKKTNREKGQKVEQLRILIRKFLYELIIKM